MKVKSTLSHSLITLTVTFVVTCISTMLLEVLSNYQHMDPYDRQANLAVTLVMQLGSICMVSILFYSSY